MVSKLSVEQHVERLETRIVQLEAEAEFLRGLVERLGERRERRLRLVEGRR